MRAPKKGNKTMSDMSVSGVNVNESESTSTLYYQMEMQDAQSNNMMKDQQQTAQQNQQMLADSTGYDAGKSTIKSF